MAARRIDDHSSPWGKAEKGSVFPAGAHKLHVESNGVLAGGVSDYEDTEPKIKKTQEESAGKVKKMPMKPGHRN